MAAPNDAAPASNDTKPIFDGVYFSIIAEGQLHSQSVQDEISQKLTSNGAIHIPLSSSNLPNVTHLIATTSDFPAFFDAIDAHLNVVKPLWVDQSIQKKRAANPRQYSPDPALFLSDVVVTISEGVPQGDRDAIIGGLLAMGGQYSPPLTRLTTHLIALSVDNPQCQIALDKKLNCSMVLPHWFDECLKLGKKIGCLPYLLPDPPILEQKGNASARTNAAKDPEELQGASAYTPEPLTPPKSSPHISPSKGRKSLDVFRNHRVLLHSDLELSDRLNKTLSQIIYDGGGDVVARVDDSDMIICQYRSGAIFQAAWSRGKDIGNLNWLYYMINNNRWTSPMRRLLHFPYPKNGIPGFSDRTVCVTNYHGEARVYLESLVKAAGGKFTKGMSQDNTHLIAAHFSGEKCAAAREWDVELVNHLWLEESYAQCRVLPTSNERYITFPSQTNLTEVLGQTQVDRVSVEQKFINARSKNGLANSSPLKPKGANVRGSTNLTSKGEDTSAGISDGKENAGRVIRGAKDRAINKLHDMSGDIALFEKESKRVGGVIHGGRRVNDPDRITRGGNDQTRKRSPSRGANEEAAGIARSRGRPPKGDDGPPKKKRKQTTTATINEKVIEPKLKAVVTGYTRWKNAGDREESDRVALLKLGIKVIEAPVNGGVDVLVLPKMMRTVNSLVALAAGPTIVHESWIQDMIEAGERLPTADYPLIAGRPDVSSNADFAEILERARQNKRNGGLLHGHTIFVTEKVGGKFESMDKIIRSNGGNSMLYKGRATKLPKNPRPADPDDTADEDDDEESNPANDAGHLFLVTHQDDRPLWPKFRAMAAENGFTPRVVSSEWLLTVAVNQRLEGDVSQWEYD